MAGGPDTAPITALLDHAHRLRLRAPELAVVFSERAAALAEAAGSESLWVEAEGAAVFARVRLGQRAHVADRALTTLRAAEADGATEIALQMRADLALCARVVGAPMTGLSALRPALEHPRLRGVTRTAALLQLVGCLSHLGRRQALEDALAEAASAAAEDDDLPDADRTTVHAMVHAATAAHLRRHGDNEAAMASARAGLDLIERDDDGGQVRIRLGLELVNALLDRGNPDEARELAEHLLAGPHRAAATSPAAWLRLLMATRVLLPAAAGEAAAVMVRDALYDAKRHGHTALTARLWLELAGIEEQLARPAEALRCMQQARMAEFAHTRKRKQAVSLLTAAFGRHTQPVVDAVGLVGKPAGQRRVAARDMLERLGVTPGEGGKRRAPDAGRHLRAVSHTEPAEVSEPAGTDDDEPDTHRIPVAVGDASATPRHDVRTSDHSTGASADPGD